jgi:capsular exopolysaccharide synthesis family protein
VLAESYRQIRAPMLKQMDLAGHKSVVVLAGMPGSGASTTVSNLAEAAAASGKRTLNIDANFRRPTQHKTFGVAETPGLSDVLAGQCSLSEAILRTDSERLAILPAGTAASRVVERLAGAQFGELLAAVGADYDAVFIDVPPVIVAGDGLSIANRCDASVLVTKAYAEKRGLVSRIRNELGDTRAEFLGVVVNGVKASAGGYLRGNIRASQEYAGASK